VSESTVRRLAREGRIPAVRLTSRLIRFQRSAVLHALNGTQQKSRPRRQRMRPKKLNSLSMICCK
jgi:excisionase family DNA binding protein